jgi:AcrR family transcriptional regulator
MARSVSYPTQRGSKRRRAEHLGPERRRPLVLDKAFELFLDHGYDGTSMEAIAKAAGVSKPVVYACYPSKEELFKALLRREESRVLGEIQGVVPTSADADPEQTLVEGFTAFLGAVDASPEAYRLIFLQEGGGNAAVVARIRRGRELQVETVAEIARNWLKGRRTQAGAVETARLIGEMVVALAEAGARTLLSQPGKWTPETLGRTLGRIAAHGQSAL